MSVFGLAVLIPMFPALLALPMPFQTAIFALGALS